jgi:serine protease Do
VGNTKPGSHVALTVFRRGGSRDLQVTVAEFEQEATARAGGSKPSVPELKPQVSPAQQQIGIVVTELTAAQKKESKVKGGVRVEAVAEGAASRAGVREGDIITAIGNTEINSVKDFESAVAKLDKSKPIPLLLRRGELASYLVIRPARG